MTCRSYNPTGLPSDPLYNPLAWCIEITGIEIAPDFWEILGRADIAAWQRELELAEANDNGRRRDQTPGGDYGPD